MIRVILDTIAAIAIRKFIIADALITVGMHIAQAHVSCTQHPIQFAGRIFQQITTTTEKCFVLCYLCLGSRVA